MQPGRWRDTLPLSAAPLPVRSVIGHEWLAVSERGTVYTSLVACQNPPARFFDQFPDVLAPSNWKEAYECSRTSLAAEPSR